ncbi:MAG TPA: hypothetical protein VM074_00340 [Solimonas sp.]|nr:hypothetical protein [Solimonas sp.]
MRSALLLLLGLSFLANGLFMLAAPMPWYELVPGVKGTGPFNIHFIRDIGCAYVMCGGSLLWLMRDARAWPAVLAAGMFLGMHAVLHIYEALRGPVELPHLASDLVLVVLPAALTLWLARTGREKSGFT